MTVVENTIQKTEAKALLSQDKAKVKVAAVTVPAVLTEMIQDPIAIIVNTKALANLARAFWYTTVKLPQTMQRSIKF